jgi:RNA polymerase sigma-70 factor (ECF subfamily)
MILFQNRKSEFEKVTWQFAESLFRFAFYRLRNKEDAEDALQATYLRAFRSFRTFKKDSNAKAWLTKILVNVINDKLNERRHQPPTENFEESLEEVEMQANDLRAAQDPGYQMERDEVDPILMRSLRELPGIMLQPLLLREIQDLTYVEIAEVLDLPIGTVMSRLFRARQLLRARLKKCSNAPETLPNKILENNPNELL